MSEAEYIPIFFVKSVDIIKITIHSIVQTTNYKNENHINTFILITPVRAV